VLGLRTPTYITSSTIFADPSQPILQHFKYLTLPSVLTLLYNSLPTAYTNPRPSWMLTYSSATVYLVAPSYRQCHGPISCLLFIGHKNWPYITITFWYLLHGSCKTAFMPLAACMILQQCWLQLVKLSRPFGLSLLRPFESFNIIV